MPAPAPHIDLATVDLGRVIADRGRIYSVLPHGAPMQLVTAVVHLDPEHNVIVGYKDVAADEFWVSGHMPGFPLLPGVLMCEAAAQVAAYCTMSRGLHDGLLMGLGGVENTRFRRSVRPGERLVLVGKGLKVRQKMTQFNVQGFVGGEMAFHTDVIGVALGRTEDL